jgi:diaminopimelate epimerase
MHFNFWKWEGTGNDFILLDQREWSVLPDEQNIARWCNRENGLGADGVIFFQPVGPISASGMCNAWQMDYLNADGSRSFCGNGSRALFAFLCGQGWMEPAHGVLHACDGKHAVKWHPEFDVPAVQLLDTAPPADAPCWWSPSGIADFVDTGSPHHIEWGQTETISTLDVALHGSAIRSHKHYAPDGVNVDFVARVSPVQLRMRTFERGVEAETKACGTGAAAAAIADFNREGGANHRKVVMTGGELIIEFDPEQKSFKPYRNVWLAGAAQELARGTSNGVRWLVASMLVILFLGSALPSMAGELRTPSIWTDSVQVSVLTGSPGSDLYSAWGHTAIRVTDWGQTPPIDWTYNYGTFQFSEGFYARFMRGQLDYRLAKSSFGSFQQDYLTSNRAILEQKLELSASDARLLIQFLEWNHLPENRVYAYKFLHDNCSTRALDAMKMAWGERFDAYCGNDAARAKKVTYRQALEPYIEGDPWIEAGIDFILGCRVDEPMPSCGSSFLPDGLMAQLHHAKLDGHFIAGKPFELLPPQSSWFRAVRVSHWNHPISMAALILLWSLGWSVKRGIQFRKDVSVRRAERWLGKLVQALAGLLGVILMLMWTITDHQDTWANWNLIWASPLLLVLGLARQYSTRFADRLQSILAVVILLFIVGVAIVPQFVSLVSTLLAWSVWLSLDPWKWPWKDGNRTVFGRNNVI